MLELIGEGGTLEITGRTIIDHIPVSRYTVRNRTLEVGEVLCPTKSDVQSGYGIKRVATVHSTQAITDAHGVVVSLQGDNDADLFPSPVADILEDGVVRRISHDL